MATHRERVVLSLSDKFGTDMAAIRVAARALGHNLTLREATWEPHDWSDWEA